MSNQQQLNQHHLEKFNEWVRSKTQAPLSPKDNVLAFPAPKTLLQVPKNTFDYGKKQTYANHFYKPEPNKSALPTPKPGLSKRNQEEENQKYLLLNLACNNCGEIGHNSMSCSKPSPKK